MGVLSTMKDGRIEYYEPVETRVEHHYDKETETLTVKYFLKLLGRVEVINLKIR